MKQRTITGLILAVVLIPLLVLGGYFILALAVLLSYGAGYELLNMFSTKVKGLKKYRFIFPLFSSLLVLTLFDTVTATHDWVFLFTMITATFVSSLIITLFDSSLHMSDVGYLFITTIYSGIGFAVLAGVRNISNVGLVMDAKYLGLFLFIYLCASTMCTDMGAYFVGVNFGKHRLCPKISPKKSIEGSIGGSIIGTIIGTIIFLLIQNHYGFKFNDSGFINVLLIIVLTLLITIVGQIGDLVASKFKRDFGIKDYSNIFPGHGGILDRFDSLLLTGIFFYLICLNIGIL